jgi:hypothetical protein
MALGAFMASSANALTFLGLDSSTKDQIDTVGFTIAPGDGVFVDSADTLDIAATADDITATPTDPVGPSKVLLEIGGGALDINFDLDLEALVYTGFADIFIYTAELSGRAGEADVSLFSPTGGPAPEQDGRLLIEGEFLGGPALFEVTFSASGGAPTLTFSGEFTVQAGGDETFKQAFGTTGNLADLLGTTTTSSPTTAVLLSDGYIFSDRLDGGVNPLTACIAAHPGGGPCGGTITGDTADFTFGGTGEIQPMNPAPFVPEPATATMLALGLLGLAAHRRSRGN